MPTLKQQALILFVCFATIATTGCAAYMAANQPAPKNFALLQEGTERSRVIAEFGTPVSTDTSTGQRKDIFTFRHGYHAAVRAGRAIGHGVASVATLGLWEVVGTPVEGYMNGSELSVEVTYDDTDRITSVVPLKGDEEVTRNLADVAEANTPQTTGSVQATQ
ncbi:MAG: hypothetical protein AAGG72_08755 [Pseudomonadota bacterium]